MPGPRHLPERPAHHAPDGRFRVTWERPALERAGGMPRWMWERFREPPPPNPPAEAFPTAHPRVALPSAGPADLRITWIGHASFLIQLGGLNILTDPVWSERASPFQWMGPRRLTRPGVPLDDLPSIDAVVISHDHYDHLDDPTVRRLAQQHGERVTWVTPLRYRDWLRTRGCHEVVELDWWESANLGSAFSREAVVQVTCTPCQHWTRRRFKARQRLWGAWSLRASASGPSVYFAGDSGYFPGYPEVARRMGPFDAVLMPIGAYEPRWFMRVSHMNPEEAVQAYRDLGSKGLFVGMHWGTFRLTDEDMLEPPLRTRRAWSLARLPEADLWIPAVGETREVVLAARMDGPPASGSS